MTAAQPPVSESSLRLSARKVAIRDLADLQAPDRDRWIRRNSFYYDEDYRYMRFLIPEGSRVLDLGCGTGRLLAALKPSRGVGVDFSSRVIDIACEKYPNLEFRVGDIEDGDVVGRI